MTAQSQCVFNTYLLALADPPLLTEIVMEWWGQGEADLRPQQLGRI